MCKVHWLLGSFLVGIVNNIASCVNATIQNGWFLCDERWSRLHRSNFTAIYVVIVTLPAYCLFTDHFFSILRFLVCCCAHFFLFHRNTEYIRVFITNRECNFPMTKMGDIFPAFLSIVKFHFQFNSFCLANGKRRVLIVVCAHAFYTRTMNPTNNDLFSSELCYIVAVFMWINLDDRRYMLLFVVSLPTVE